MTSIRILIAATSAALAFGAHAAGDPVSGQKKNAQCQGCHGIPGWKTAFPEIYQVPKLGGQHPQYIVSALKAYKSGERDHPTMRAVVSDLSDKDMEDLGAYYGASAAPAKAAEVKK